MTPSSDLAILRWLAARDHVSAAEIGISCQMTAAEVRACLVMLDLRGLVSGRQDIAVEPPQRIYSLTGEGRRAAGIRDARATNIL